MGRNAKSALSVQFLHAGSHKRRGPWRGYQLALCSKPCSRLLKIWNFQDRETASAPWSPGVWQIQTDQFKVFASGSWWAGGLHCINLKRPDKDKIYKQDWSYSVFTCLSIFFPKYPGMQYVWVVLSCCLCIRGNYTACRHYKQISVLQESKQEVEGSPLTPAQLYPCWPFMISYSFLTV